MTIDSLQYVRITIKNIDLKKHYKLKSSRGLLNQKNFTRQKELIQG